MKRQQTGSDSKKDNNGKPPARDRGGFVGRLGNWLQQRPNQVNPTSEQSTSGSPPGPAKGSPEQSTSGSQPDAAESKQELRTKWNPFQRKPKPDEHAKESRKGKEQQTDEEDEDGEAAAGHERWENGGYLVYRAEDDSTGCITVDKYRPIYNNLIGITFPVSGDADVMSALVPDYAPETGPRDYLVKEYQNTQYSFIFIPRTVYDYLYFIFASTQTLARRLPSEAIEYTDGNMCVASQGYGEYRNLVDYYVAMISNDNVIHRHAHFNAWALAWMKKTSRDFHGALTRRTHGCVSRFDVDQLLQIVTELTRLNISAPADLNRILADIVRQETTEDRCTFLLRYVPDGPRGMNYPTRIEGGQSPGVKTHSMSFSPGLFAAAAPHADHNACTYFHLDKIGTFMLPISIDDYRNRRNIPAVFHIPPFPAIVQVHACMQELWHPRTRFFKVVKQGKISVDGINVDSLPRGTDKDWQALGFLLYKDGTPMKPADIIELSRNVNSYIVQHAIIIVPIGVPTPKIPKPGDVEVV